MTNYCRRFAKAVRHVRSAFDKRAGVDDKGENLAVMGLHYPRRHTCERADRIRLGRGGLPLRPVQYLQDFPV